jgi:hypothetical protein
MLGSTRDGAAPETAEGRKKGAIKPAPETRPAGAYDAGAALRTKVK